jgi:P-type Ca2+ transporter type 2C
VGTLAVMDWALPGGLIAARRASTGGLRYAQTMAFTTLVFYQLCNTFNARFRDRSAFHRMFANRWLWAAVLGSAGLQVTVVYTPFLQRAFSTVPLAARDWSICIAVASTVLWVVEIEKLALRARGRSAKVRT